MPNSLNFSPDSDASLLNKKNDKPSVSGDFFVMDNKAKLLSNLFINQ